MSLRFIVFDILLLVASFMKDSYCSKVISPSNVSILLFTNVMKCIVVSSFILIYDN